MDNFCSKCGSPIQARYRYCTQCGSPVNIQSWHLSAKDGRPGFDPVEQLASTVKPNESNVQFIQHVVVETQPCYAEYYTDDTVVFGSEGSLEDTTVWGHQSEDDDSTRILMEEHAYLTDAQGVRMLIQPPCVIGRGSGVDVRITGNTAISRQHVKFVKEGDEYRIQDLGAVNGTFLDGRALSSGAVETILSGQTLRLGSEDLVFEVERGSIMG